MDTNTNKQYQSTSYLEGELLFPLSLFRICAVCVCVYAHMCVISHTVDQTVLMYNVFWQRAVINQLEG